MITLFELFDLVIMTAAIAFIFKDMVPNVQDKLASVDPIAYYKKRSASKEQLKMAALAAGPAVILHEAAHKFFGTLFGLESVFHASYFWLLLGVVLKVLRFPFIFFVPGYVSLFGSATAVEVIVISVAGPVANLVLWGLSSLAIKKRWFKPKFEGVLHLSKNINLFLFIFNMLPLPGLDGYKFFMFIGRLF